MNNTERQTLSATTLIGDKVRNPDGEDLGEMTDLMIDLEVGDIAYAVVDLGGFLGTSGKLFAVPWKALGVDSENHEMTLDIARERLENAPGFDPDDWPDFSDRTWGSSVHEHYGIPPYWED